MEGGTYLDRLTTVGVLVCVFGEDGILTWDLESVLWRIEHSIGR